MGLWPAWIALACSLALTAVVWRYSSEDVERQLRLEFEAEATQARADLDSRMAAYTQTLRGAAALFAASERVTSKDWRDYVAGLKLETNYPGIQAVIFSRSVAESELGALVRSMRNNGMPDFAAHPAGRREHYVVNVYAEPRVGLNNKAIGLDMWQNPESRETMQRARGAGEPMITGRVTLLIDDQNPVPSFIMYLPVMTGSGKEVFGYVLSPVRMPALMADLLKRNPRGISLSIHDGTVAREENLLYSSDPEQIGPPARFGFSEKAVVGGRPWTLTYSSRPALEARGDTSRPTKVLLGGLLGSALLFSIALSLATNRDRAVRLAGRMTASLRESEAQFRVLVEQAPDAIAVYDVDLGRFIEANSQAEQLFGCPREELLAGGPERFLPPGIFNGKFASENLQEMIDRVLAGDHITMESSFLNAQGQSLHCEMRLVRLPAVGRRLVRGSFVDITERRLAEKARAQEQETQRHSEERVRLLLNSTGEAIYGIDREGRCTFCNPAGVRMLGWADERDLLGHEMHGLTHFQKPDGSAYPADECPIYKVLETGEDIWVEDEVFFRADGLGFPVRYGAHPLRRDGKIVGVVVTFTDITLRKAAETEIRNLAFYDPLTGLPNRRLMLDRLCQALTSSARRGRHGALMLFDLDDFKTLNDTLGHDVGDQFLVEVAARMESCIREGDTVARLGGDEFVVILEDLDAEASAATQAEIVAVKIQAALNQPYALHASYADDRDTRSYHCTSSIGITLFRDQSLSADELLKRADTAMYQAKAAGRNTLRFFDPEMQAAVAARAILNSDLRSAVRDRQFLLHYQPQVDGAGLVTGVEALVRWQHPRRGMVPPGDFIPLAEDNGLILPLGRWVLETACQQLAVWGQREESSHLTMAVNVSGREFRQKNFVDDVLAILRDTGASSARLKLELTESLLLHDVEDMIAKMAALQGEGVSFSLDDFGTGYSSLSYLKRLPLGQLKIDQSFVQDVLDDNNDAAIVRTIIALGQSLGLGVIAEGVETQGQREFLARQGCQAYQGFLFGRPGTADDLLKGCKADD
ncbi:bifunctional diguanylate cyclase/phosphodiesterase [Sulfuritalea hydrogenivorans]|uniref:PAS domain S-box/diguanylate cyclase (GGDEF) domain-containing protein n=1 Tax=Sulfuritalea hydrogenivorans sk43H TaxID=1223802 RepID=W0SG82_9PROT|nr:EAL domain-containing protein [Sulfuritalea hydrogenivorans]BAO29942.1 PAS domain S-box/diguanylate cyclase (GGDEF) domain-containing protein [Sulfuritalea hydrogenivorans sk43H]